ncbi:MAG TPA: PAS domain S-box protein [Phototrophicaceae bacterium]|nr:PAS domain S-box protein [Phototrophicaceae bacterium]
MSQGIRQRIIKYAVAVGIVIVVTALKLVIIAPFVGNQQWFLMFTAAICLSSWYGGYGSGAVTAVLSALSAALFFVSPANGADLASPAILFQLLFFLLEGLLTVGFTGNLRETRAKAVRDEQAKDEALALLDTFQVYAPVGLAFLDTNLRYVRINYAMAELAGLTPAAHLGHTLQEIDPALSQQTLNSIREVLTTGKPLLDQEVTVTRPSLLGIKKQSFLTSYYRMRGAEGQTIGVGIVMLDITERKQAEDTLRESEARFRTMADGAPVMIWMADTEMAGTYYNQVWRDFTGRTMEQELDDGWKASVHPDDLQRFTELYTTASLARQPYELEYRLKRADGEYRWVLNHGVPLFTPQGIYNGYIGSTIDITERRRLEAGQQFVLDAGVALVSSLDYEATLGTVVKLAVPEIADWCAIDLLTPENTIQRVAVAHIDPEKVRWAYEIQQRFPPTLNSPNGVGLVLRTGQTEFVPDLPALMAPIYNTLSDEVQQIMDKLQAVSVITAPLIARGKTIGALTFATAESGRRYNQIDVQIAETLAARAALAVDNARLYGESRTERERFRVTLTSIGDAVIATDARGQVSFINQVAQDLTGWTAEQALNQPLDEVFKIVNEQSRQAVESPVKRVLREGVVVGLANHTVLISRLGKETPIDDSGAPIPADDGSIGGVVLVFRDVSERKHEEERQQFLVEASELLSSSLDYETTLADLTHLIVPRLADWCSVDLLSPDRQQLDRVSVAHIDPEKVKWAYELTQRYPIDLSGHGGPATVIRTGETYYLPDISEAMIEGAALDADMYAILKQLALSSEIVVPLIARGQTLGILTLVYAESKRHYTQTEIVLAEQLASRAALAVDNARLYSAAQTERERFRVTLTSIGDAVIATDAEGKVSFINQVAQNLTDWSDSDALGQPLDDVFKIINEQTRELVESPVKRVLAEGVVVGLANHTILVSRTGKETPIDDSGAPIPGDTSNTSGVVLVFRDVTQRKLAENRQQFLVEAGNLLISSLDYETTLRQIVRLAVPSLADWAVIYLRDEDGSVRQAEAYHLDPEKVALREEMMRRYVPSPDHPHGYPRVFSTGEAELLTNLDQQIESIARDEEHLRYLRAVGYTSSLTVPLKERERIFGAFALAMAESKRAFHAEDTALLQEFSKIAGLAIANARLYTRSQGNNPLAPNQHDD